LVQAEKLIRELNLFPKNDLNVIDGRYSSPPPKNKIVEKRLVFHNFVRLGAFRDGGRGDWPGPGPPPPHNFLKKIKFIR
jgi:hypothetical protein